MGVEDAQSEHYIPVTVEVSTCMTIAQLKEKVVQYNSYFHYNNMHNILIITCHSCKLETLN